MLLKLQSNIENFLKKLIEHKDLFIAVTALSMNIPIATENKKHFERIGKLKIIN